MEERRKGIKRTKERAERGREGKWERADVGFKGRVEERIKGSER